ncbi:MAG: antitoxin [Catenulispora sp.]|nr:antitoxin [Catenulispora sp.]
MTQTIKGNVAGGVDKAAEKAKGATGNKYDDKIDSGVQKAKDRLR